MQNQHRTARTPAQRAALLKFTPVPRERIRADGWLPERQQAFIEALADTGCVVHAARMVGMAPEGAYALRRHPHGRSFAEAWDRAQDVGVQRLRDIAIERAIEGTAIPIFHRGEQVGERRLYNDRLLMFILRHHDPDRYGSGSPAGRLSPATIRKLRTEWEEERAAQQRQRERTETREMRDKITEELLGIHRRLVESSRWETMRKQLDERARLGLFGPHDPENKRPPLPPQIPSPWAKPGYEYPRGHGPEGRPPPSAPTIRNV